MRRARALWGVSLAGSLGVGTLCWAGYPDAVAAAHAALEDAQEAARVASPECQGAAEKLEGLMDRVTDLHEHPEPPRVRGTANDLTRMGIAAISAGCPAAVSQAVRRSVEALELAHGFRLQELAGPAGAGWTRPDAAPRMMTDAELLGLLQDIRGAEGEAAKKELATRSASALRLSAAQLNAILDQVPSDEGKLEVVMSAAPRLASVDAESLSARFADAAVARRAAAVTSRPPAP
jgi:hypothetical protein